MPVAPSNFFTSAFVMLVLTCSAGLLGLVWRAYRSRRAREGRRALIGTGVFMVALLFGTLWVGASGVLRQFDTMPPPIMAFLLVLVATTVGLCSFAPVGERLALGLPTWVLVISQGFRLPVELLLHRAAKEGFMPPQMSWSGRNFDVVTAILAIGLGVWGMVLDRRHGREMPPWSLWLFNIVGLALLINVVTVAMLSMPTPMRVFTNEPANVWVTYAPFIWLPAVLVQTALAGHLVIFRRLRLDARRA